MNKEDSKNVLAVLGLPVALAFMIVLMLPIGLLNAWAVQKMYIWFLLPLGLPALNLWHMFAIVLLINHFATTTPYKKQPFSKVLTKIGISIFGMLFMLLMGFILKGHI